MAILNIKVDMADTLPFLGVLCANGDAEVKAYAGAELRRIGRLLDYLNNADGTRPLNEVVSEAMVANPALPSKFN